MMSRFSSFVLALLLLVASGQVMAATCTSVVAGGVAWGTGTTYTAWTNAAVDGCNSVAGTADSLPTNAEDVIVASTTAALTGSTAMVAKSLTISTGATFSPGSNTITISGNFTNDGTFTNTSSTVVFDATATVGGSAVTTFNNLTANTAGTLTLPATATIAGSLVLTTSSTLALASTNTVGGAVTTYGTGLTGTLKLTGGSRTITASADATIPVLDLSSLTDASTITTATSNVVVNSLILPTANPVGGAAKTVIFKVPSAKTLQIPAAFNTASTATTAGCVATGYTFTSGLMTGTGTATDNVTCTVPAAAAPSTTSAPIFSTKEKAAVFSQEVK